MISGFTLGSQSANSVSIIVHLCLSRPEAPPRIHTNLYFSIYVSWAKQNGSGFWSVLTIVLQFHFPKRPAYSPCFDFCRIKWWNHWIASILSAGSLWHVLGMHPRLIQICFLQAVNHAGEDANLTRSIATYTRLVPNMIEVSHYRNTAQIIHHNLYMYATITVAYCPNNIMQLAVPS